MQTSSGLTVVIIPVFNEKQVVEAVVKTVIEAGYTIVLVDDGSTDGIPQQIKQISGLHYLRHKVNLGQGAALQTGLDFAVRLGADYFVTFDADGQHRVEDIPVMLAPLQQQETDIVLASRFLEEGDHNASLRRKWLLKLATWVNYIFTGIYLSDAHNGLRAMNRFAATTIRITENRMAHATEIIAQVKMYKLRYKEVAAKVVYTPYSRQKGQSGLYSIKIFFDLVLQKLFR